MKPELPRRRAYRRILNFLWGHPWSSSSVVARGVGLKAGQVHPRIREMVAKGVLEKLPGKGPRGGWGYRALVPDPLPLSQWERLLGEDIV